MGEYNSCGDRESKQKPAGCNVLLLLSLHLRSPSSIRYIPPVLPGLPGSLQGRKMRGHAFGIRKNSDLCKLSSFGHLQIPPTPTGISGSTRSEDPTPKLCPPSDSCGPRQPGGKLGDAERGRERIWCVAKLKLIFR